jgi:hypothetical protein
VNIPDDPRARVTAFFDIRGQVKHAQLIDGRMVIDLTTLEYMNLLRGPFGSLWELANSNPGLPANDPRDQPIPQPPAPPINLPPRGY